MHFAEIFDQNYWKCFTWIPQGLTKVDLRRSTISMYRKRGTNRHNTERDKAYPTETFCSQQTARYRQPNVNMCTSNHQNTHTRTYVYSTRDRMISGFPRKILLNFPNAGNLSTSGPQRLASGTVCPWLCCAYVPS